MEETTKRPPSASGDSLASRRPIAPFVVSLVGGLWMLTSAGMMTAMFHGGMHGPMMGPWAHHPWRTWAWHHTYLDYYGASALLGWVAVVASLVVIGGAVVIYARPDSAGKAGAAIVAASIVGLLTGVGLLAGVLGLVGGILALVWFRNSARAGSA